MIYTTWISALLLLHRAQAYILLTATLDDVQAIAKQISESPVAGQLNSILRRATTLFNEQVRASRTLQGYKLRNPRTISEDYDSPLEPIEGRKNYRRNLIDKKPDIVKPNQVDEPRNSQENNLFIDKRSEIDGSEDRTKEETRARQVEVEDDNKTDKSVSQNDEIPQDKVQESVDVGEKRSITDEVVALGKNASYYLNSMKQIIEKETNNNTYQTNLHQLKQHFDGN